MSHSKPLLMPWLRAHIDSGKYPGVQWTNLERTQFTIPWKHALRQDSSDTDILIFKAWAEVSGNGQAHGDASVWKRNFRSALRAKGFKLVSDNKNDNANPHKVFHWPDESMSRANSSSGGSQDRDDPDLFEGGSLPAQEIQVVFCPSPLENTFFLSTAESSTSQDILDDCLRGLNIGPETEGSAGFELPPEQQHLQTRVVIGGCALPGQQQDPVTCEGAIGEAQLPEQPACPMEMAVGGASGEQLAEQFLQTMSRTRDGDHFKTQFKLSVFYRGEKVLEQLVENESGFRLIFRPEFTGMPLDPVSGLSLVSLPSPRDMVDQTQDKLTQRILDKMGDGLDFGVSGRVVYAQRRGESKAFWSFSKFDRSRTPQEIPKLQPERLYQLKDFYRGILEFIEGGASPPCSLFLCLGEKWPDPDNRPWMKKLITVEVSLTSMELLKNIAVAGGASSLNSVELQMSLGEMMEMD